jgi:hypothetical protein
VAWTTPKTDFSPGNVLTAAQMNAIGGNLVELAPFFASWTSWTPTLSGGWALGNGTTVAHYLKVGTRVHFYAKITTGTTSTLGTNFTMSLPVTARSADALVNTNAFITEVAVADYVGLVYPASTTTIQVRCVNASVTYALQALVTSTVPFTWSSRVGSSVSVAGTYEAASA